MRVVITAAGTRTEHWTSLLASLCRRPDITPTVLAPDISELSYRELARHARQYQHLRYHRVPHLLGEAAYPSTWQVIRPTPFSLLERRAYRAVDHTFPVTPAALKVLWAKGHQGTATIVPLGVDAAVFTPPGAPAQHPPQGTPPHGALPQAVLPQAAPTRAMPPNSGRRGRPRTATHPAAPAHRTAAARHVSTAEQATTPQRQSQPHPAGPEDRTAMTS